MLLLCNGFVFHVGGFWMRSTVWRTYKTCNFFEEDKQFFQTFIKIFCKQCKFLLKKRKQNRGMVPNIERDYLGIWNILALCTGKLIPKSNSAIYLRLIQKLPK